MTGRDLEAHVASGLEGAGDSAPSASFSSFPPAHPQACPPGHLVSGITADRLPRHTPMLQAPVNGEGVLPEGLYEPLHLLGLPLHTDVSLELPQGLIQLHAGEVHLVHHAAEGRWEEGW